MNLPPPVAADVCRLTQCGVRNAECGMSAFKGPNARPKSWRARLPMKLRPSRRRNPDVSCSCSYAYSYSQPPRVRVRGISPNLGLSAQPGPVTLSAQSMNRHDFVAADVKKPWPGFCRVLALGVALVQGPVGAAAEPTSASPPPATNA